MRWTRYIIPSILFIYLALVIFFNRGLFFSKFDQVYWQDKYDHSQWKLPLSVRTLGDDGLYLYEGYRLIHGGDPTLLNAEVPPLGKYIIGATIIVFGNGNIYGLLVNIAVLAAVYFLVYALTKNALISWGAVLLLATDPLFTAQYTITMLDNLQSLFLLLYLALLFVQSQKNKQVALYLTVGAGIALGFFSETKFPILAPLPFLLGAIYLWVTRKHIVYLAYLALGCMAGYLIPYIPYFLSGHTIIEWFAVQKWIVSFYLRSELVPTIGSALATIITGQYQNIFSREWLPSPQWTPVWILLVGLSLPLIFWKKNKPHTFFSAMIGVLSVFILTFYSVIPFWTRYIVLLLPLWYILFTITITRVSTRLQILLISVCVAINIATSIPQFFPTPEGVAKLFIYNWENSFFQDMYEDTSTTTKSTQTRDEFRKFGLLQTSVGQIEKVHIDIQTTQWPKFTSVFSVPVNVRYTTRYLGEFTVKSTIRFTKEHNRWRVDWKWSDYLPDLAANTTLRTTVFPARRGSIVGSDKKPLAEDISSILISVVPGKIKKDQEESMLTYLETLFEQKIKAVYIHQRIFGNSRSDVAVQIGVVPHAVTGSEKRTLQTFEGVSWIDYIGRANYGSDLVQLGSVANSLYYECCSLLYSTTNYDGVDGVEKKRNEILKGINGGSLTLSRSDGSVIHTFINQEKKDGQDAEP